MLVRGQNHCCCKPPKQCEQEVQFNPYNFDETEKPGTTTIFDVYYDNSTSSVTLTGEGSLTTRVTDNPKTIFVHAHILDLNAGSGGIMIRRIDSNDSISLWYLGGTSYELRQGTTVLESITSTSGGEIKLELATPREATTDVLVYIDGVLEHTETGVSFTMPDVLHLGMVVEGASGGDIRFGYLAVSPCPTDCEVVSYCYDNIWDDTVLRMPRTWYASIPWPSDHGFTDCSTLLVDFLYPQEAWFIPATDAVFYNHDIEAWDDWGGCGFVPVTPHRVTIGDPQYTVDPYDLPPLPSGKWPVEYGGTCVGDTLVPYYNSAYVSGRSVHSWRFNVEFQNVGTLGSPIVEYRIRVHISDRDPMSNVIVEHVVYASSWVPIIGNDTLDSFVTLTLIANNSPYTGWDSTITLTPEGPSKPIMRYLAKCGDLCTPPVTPQLGTCYVQTINLVDADDNPWYMTAVLGAQFDEVTGNWYWQGNATPHPLAKPHPACGDIIFGTVKIHCVELEEGASKTWVLDFTYDGQTERFPISEDPQFEFVWEGTTDIMCSGQIWDFFAGPISPTESTYQFGSCEWDACADPHGYYFAAWLNTECYGEAGIDFPEYRSGPLIFSPTSARPWMSAPVGTVYFSSVPSAYAGSGAIAGVFLYVESGTVRVQFVDGSLNPVADMFASVGYSCEPTIGRPEIDDTSPISYMWGFPDPTTADPFGVCAGTSGNGSWEITFS